MVADLLECLIQIKALRVTTGRLAERARAAAASGAPGRIEALATAEEAFARGLRSALPDGPSLPPPTGAASPGPPDSQREAGPLDHFLSIRRASLALLDRCSAADLAAHASVPGRGTTTVADVVALMLAADTMALGELRAGAGPEGPAARSHP